MKAYFSLFLGMIIGALSSMGWGMENHLNNCKTPDGAYDLEKYFEGERPLDLGCLSPKEIFAQNRPPHLQCSRDMCSRMLLYVDLASELPKDKLDKTGSSHSLTNNQWRYDKSILESFREAKTDKSFYEKLKNKDNAEFVEFDSNHSYKEYWGNFFSVESFNQGNLARKWKAVFRKAKLEVCDKQYAPLQFPPVDFERFDQWTFGCNSILSTSLEDIDALAIIEKPAEHEYSAKLQVIKFFAHIAHTIPDAALIEKYFPKQNANLTLLKTLARNYKTIEQTSHTDEIKQWVDAYFPMISEVIKEIKVRYTDPIPVWRGRIGDSSKSWKDLVSKPLSSQFSLPPLTIEDDKIKNWNECVEAVKRETGSDVDTVVRKWDEFSKTKRYCVLRLYTHLAHSIPDHIFADQEAIKDAAIVPRNANHDSFRSKCYWHFDMLRDAYQTIAEASTIDDMEKCVDQYFEFCLFIDFASLEKLLTIWKNYKILPGRGSNSKHQLKDPSVPRSPSVLSFKKPILIALGAALIAGIAYLAFKSEESEHTEEKIAE